MRLPFQIPAIKSDQLIKEYQRFNEDRWAKFSRRWSGRRYAGFVLLNLLRHGYRPCRPLGVSEAMVVEADIYLRKSLEMEAAADKDVREEAKP